MTKNKETIDLKFGDPALIRGCLKGYHSLLETDLGYKVGDNDYPSITKWIKKYYKNNFNLEYKNIILTHGANGALENLVTILSKSHDIFIYNDMAFGWYKKIMEMSDTRYRIEADLRTYENKDFYGTVFVVDSPNNPWGYNIINEKLNKSTVIWDSVYASKIFVNGALVAPDHNIMIGSLSKMLGLSGLRIGWIGTNDDFLAMKLQHIALTSYCGLSTASLEIANNIVSTIDLDGFEKVAKINLDYSRDSFNKLKNIFNLEVPSSGMFYMGVLDKVNKKILDKANVLGLELTSVKDIEYIRFNMADYGSKTELAIKRILKADRI